MVTEKKQVDSEKLSKIIVDGMLEKKATDGTYEKITKKEILNVVHSIFIWTFGIGDENGLIFQTIKS